MTEGDLTRVADEKIKPNSYEHVNGHVIGYVDIIVLDQERKCCEKKDEDRKPEDSYTRGKKADIFIVIPLHVHAARLPKAVTGWPLREKARMPCPEARR
jgi:hypothetical protein